MTIAIHHLLRLYPLIDIFSNYRYRNLIGNKDGIYTLLIYPNALLCWP